MANLPPNVIRFPRPYRRPPERSPARQPDRPRLRIDRMGRVFMPHLSREEQIRECVENFLARLAYMDAQGE